MNSSLAKILIVVYGLSISGYALIDGGHEVLHILKSRMHDHVVSHGHTHDIEDHHQIFTTDNNGDVGSTEISCFLLFYQTPESYSFDFLISIRNFFTTVKIKTLTLTPPKPPPLV